MEKTYKTIYTVSENYFEYNDSGYSGYFDGFNLKGQEYYETYDDAIEEALKLTDALISTNDYSLYESTDYDQNIVSYLIKYDIEFGHEYDDHINSQILIEMLKEQNKYSETEINDIVKGFLKICQPYYTTIVDILVEDDKYATTSVEDDITCTFKVDKNSKKVELHSFSENKPAIHFGFGYGRIPILDMDEYFDAGDTDDKKPIIHVYNGKIVDKPTLFKLKKIMES